MIFLDTYATKALISKFFATSALHAVGQQRALARLASHRPNHAGHIVYLEDTPLAVAADQQVLQGPHDGWCGHGGRHHGLRGRHHVLCGHDRRHHVLCGHDRRHHGLRGHGGRHHGLRGHGGRHHGLRAASVGRVLVVARVTEVLVAQVLVVARVTAVLIVVADAHPLVRDVPVVGVVPHLVRVEAARVAVLLVFIAQCESCATVVAHEDEDDDQEGQEGHEVAAHSA